MSIVLLAIAAIAAVISFGNHGNNGFLSSSTSMFFGNENSNAGVAC